ncbi:hypothetical protein ACFS2C_09715 [Prauserella oleivorans]|uniref:Small hydrophilic protein n=1 Tax=Prauserella oleivorans TaxID=1478153 RepID=A0ABW5W9L0_9PSEU
MTDTNDAPQPDEGKLERSQRLIDEAKQAVKDDQELARRQENRDVTPSGNEGPGGRPT